MGTGGGRERVGNGADEKLIIVQGEGGETSGGARANDEVISLQHETDGDMAVGITDGSNE